MYRRLGIDPDPIVVPPRKLILEEQFLPMEHTPAGDAAAREITRELATRTTLAVKDEEGYTLAEAVTAGGPARARRSGDRRLRVAVFASRTRDGRSHAVSR